MTQKQRRTVIEVAQILTIDAVAFFVGSIILLSPPLRGQGVFENIVGSGGSILLFVMGTTYTVLAYGFYHLRPWAYNPVSFLVTIDGLSFLAGLGKKVQLSEVRRAFGLDVDST